MEGDVEVVLAREGDADVDMWARVLEGRIAIGRLPEALGNGLCLDS